MITFPRPDIVSLVACGPSALKCGAVHAPGMVVAINGAAKHVPHTAAFTMDGRYARNEWQNHQFKPFVVRESAWQHAVRAGARETPTTVRFAGDNKSAIFAENPENCRGGWQLNGSNSGYCALNFAYSLRPRKVILYGYDMDVPTHFFGDYSWKGEGDSLNANKLQLWAAEMEYAAHQFRKARIDVVNTNRASAIKAFRFGDA